MTKNNKTEVNFPSGSRTITLRDLDEETWFHLLATIDARANHFENRLAEARRFNDPEKVIEHYQWVIDMHKEISSRMRQQIWNAVK